MDDYMLTTIDNPFNPYTQFEDWYAFDEQKGYFTCELLERIAKTTNDLSESEEDQSIKEAIDRVIEINPLGLYIKFYKDSGIKS